MKRVILSALVIGLISVIGCVKSTGSNSSYTPDCTTTATFAAQVMPLISSSCANNTSCHASGSSHGPGALTNYSQVFASRSSIRQSVARGTMPEGSTLSASQKNTIVCWIDAGAPNN